MVPRIHFIHQFATPSRLSDGTAVLARVYTAQQATESWVAWFVFFPVDRRRPFATAIETTQRSADAVGYWAEGIEPAYLEGALARALEQQSGRVAVKEQAPYRRGEERRYRDDKPEVIALAHARAEARQRAAHSII